MAKFFRMSEAGELSDTSDSEGSSCHSGLSSPEPLAPLRPSSNDRNGSSSPEALDFDEYLIDRPTLPVHPSLIPAVRFNTDPNATPPGELPAAVVQNILRIVPTRDWSDEDDLESHWALLKRYGCDGVDAWLQAVDPSTGNSLVHAIVLSGRLGALGACQEYPPKCAFRGAATHLKAERETCMLLTHQNHEGDTGLHIAARTGSLPMAKALLHMIEGLYFEASRVDEDPEQFDRPKLEGVVDWTIFGSPKRVFFIETRNNSGRDAIQEARYYEREEVAVFLEHVLDQSYPPDCVDRASIRQAWRLIVDRRYRSRTPQEEV